MSVFSDPPMSASGQSETSTRERSMSVRLPAADIDQRDGVVTFAPNPERDSDALTAPVAGNRTAKLDQRSLYGI
jgi:hypothetical protein